MHLEYTALLIGFMGSFHCVMMCGPIALILSQGQTSLLGHVVGKLVYNGGRIATYAILGVVAGLAGHSLSLAGFQSSLSVGLGLLMIAGALAVYVFNQTPALGSIAMNLNGFIRKVFQKTLRKRNRLSQFVSGMANGLLPCGFVYLALTGSVAMQSAGGGALYMMLFGLGTFPAMFLVASLGKYAGSRVHGLLSKWAPILIVALGLLFIYRGMSTSPVEGCPLHPNGLNLQAQAR